jgi:peroxiredoxin
MLRILTVALVLDALAWAAVDLAGKRAPGFALPDSKMQFVDLADLRGRLVLLEIMKTTCLNCQRLAETLEKVKAKYGDKIAVVSVVNPPDNTATVAKFVADHKVTSTVLFDCGQMVGSYTLPDPKNPSIYLPHLFLIDASGIIRKHWTSADEGVFAGKGIFEEIDRALGQGGATKR